VNVQLHSVQKKGINCLDVAQNLILTGGNDGNALLFNRQTEQIQSTCAGHKKKINDVAFVQKEEQLLALVCADDCKASLFDCSAAKGKIVYKIEGHKAPITACDVHPLGFLGVVCSQDEQFSFHDLHEGKALNYVKLPEHSSQYNCLKIHPDGHVMAIGGADGAVKIWNLTDDSLLENL